MLSRTLHERARTLAAEISRRVRLAAHASPSWHRSGVPNFCAVFMRVFPVPGRSLTEKDAREAIWRSVLADRGSYLLEERSTAAAGGALDLLYGRRWGPGDDAERVLFELSELVDAVFIRYAVEGDAPDMIQQVDVECDRLRIDAWRPCAYAFDEVVVERAGGEVLREASAGTYLAQNLRDGSRPGEVLRSGEAWAGPSSFAAEGMLSQILSAEALRLALGVELWFGGRMVHRAKRAVTAAEVECAAEDGFVHWSLDGWDNCVDPMLLSSAVARR